LSPLKQIIVALICLSILWCIAETEPLIFDGRTHLFALAHASFFTIFFIEYAGRIYVAALNPRFNSGWQYARTPAAALDLVVLISFILPFLGLETALLRMFRAARLVRLARLGRYSKAMALIIEAVADRRYELGVSVVIATGLMLLLSTAGLQGQRGGCSSVAAPVIVKVRAEQWDEAPESFSPAKRRSSDHRYRGKWALGQMRPVDMPSPRQEVCHVHFIACVLV
jgi:hypothetical protein